MITMERGGPPSLPERTAPPLLASPTEEVAPSDHAAERPCHHAGLSGGDEDRIPAPARLSGHKGSGGGRWSHHRGPCPPRVPVAPLSAAPGWPSEPFRPPPGSFFPRPACPLQWPGN